ncbi:MAG: DNA repair protein RadA [Phascolarctobacterium sp.]|nr:DNA repair protein RadA [Phascolarctobacterium sp.]
MAKSKTKFVCQNCGHVESKWLGKCPACSTWDSLVEEIPVPEKLQKTYLPNDANKAVPKPLNKIVEMEAERIATSIREFDRVLGGGVVPGSLILLGGTPGIGKSTILLDAGIHFAKNGITTLYVSGEESEEQTALRARRLGGSSDKLFVMTATDLDGILMQTAQMQPKILVIDSIQTMYNSEIDSAAGSVAQVRECTAKLMQFAKTTGVAVLIIGHVTKDGNIAGPRLLEHMVDVVLQFEGDRSYAFRILRALKNRFGTTGESGIFSMEANGLVQVDNPAGLFLDEHRESVAGSVISACMEGNRPILVEMQALVARTPYGLPRRTSVGYDLNRLNMLIAILERRVGLDFGTYDAYANVVGGMKVNEPAPDLAVAAALVSAYKNIAVAKDTMLFGEIGLTGEIRRVSNPERRIADGVNLGFKRFIVPDGKLNQKFTDVEIVPVRTLTQVLEAIFG